MPRKIYKPEEIVAKLRQVDVSGPERGRGDPLDRCQRGDVKDLETDNTRLCRAVSNLTLARDFLHTLGEVQIIIESWCRHYSTVRLLASIGHRATAPEVFVPALAAWLATQSRPAPPATLKLALGPSPKLTVKADHLVVASQPGSVDLLWAVLITREERPDF